MTDWEAETARLARLARLRLAPEEARGLAAGCEAIAAEFGGLADFAAALPPPPSPAPGAPRDDSAALAPEAEVDAILAAAPRKDGQRRVLARGGP